MNLPTIPNITRLLKAENLSPFGLDRSRLGALLDQKGIGRHHLKPILNSFYHGELTPTKTHLQLSSKVQQAVICPDDLSVKLVISLHDGKLIEVMILPEKTRLTLCISSQVGCAQACVFCATGKMGMIRQLQTHEIIEQVILAKRWSQERPWQKQLAAKWNHQAKRSITNVVFMGMGEPCHNPSAVTHAAQIMVDPWCLGLAARKVTLSTAGHIHGLKKIYAAIPHISYAISIHSPSNTQRSSMMPINRRFPLADLIEFLSQCSHKDGKTFFIQYTLIHGINDSKEDAELLATTLAPIRCKINLLSFNPTDFLTWKAPPLAKVQKFAATLKSFGYQVSLRFSKGKNIQGACGQLIQTASKPSMPGY